MGRPPSNGGPAFRFNATEVTEMETILQEHHNAIPAREIMIALAEKFSEMPERKGKIVVQMKQVWNWFQNKRYALRAKSNKAPGKLNVTPMPREDSTPVRVGHQPGAAPLQAPVTTPMPVPVPVASGQVPSAGRGSAENSYMEFEAKSVRDGAWYDVQNFLAHKNLETGDPEVQVRFAGFGPDEDEWVNVRKHVRQRSLPCEASECVAVLPGDLILCFQEGKDQALYFDAHVLDAQRRRHDVRGCRCRFLVRYDHDQSEEIVPLRKVCRRPETDYRLQQLHAGNDLTSSEQQKSFVDPSAAGPQRTNITADMIQKQRNSDTAMLPPVSHAYAPVAAKTFMVDQKSTETSGTNNSGNSNDLLCVDAITSATGATLSGSCENLQ
ncbi:hypothetical protein CFOL_v3_07543 [Cephalotus follicularis]|uniref:Homeobox domain-containing protein n=1 Tax=Cephalotus follicularis TaxID=3775 RepID=A0A1Q3B800_CEPFO|nr:hypothetical protein CFOL_v3_07543 [Cephalotus follicularis]